jgi:hypothetical protein
MFRLIDGLSHRVNADSYPHRLTPPKADESVEPVNSERMGKLTDENNMQPAAAALLRSRSGVAFFSGASAVVPRTATGWASAPKNKQETRNKEEETRATRLDQLIEDSAASPTLRPLTRKRVSERRS